MDSKGGDRKENHISLGPFNVRTTPHIVLCHLFKRFREEERKRSLQKLEVPDDKFIVGKLNYVCNFGNHKNMNRVY